MNNIHTLFTEHVNGASFISINTSTEPKLTGGKKNPHLGHVRKVMEGANVMVFQNKTINGYEAMVKRRLEKEGKSSTLFDLSPRVWGTRIPNTPFVEHKGNYYLEVIFLKSGGVTYTLQGVPVEADTIQGLKLNNEEADQGGLNDKVIIRSFKIESIRSLTIAGDTYTNLVYLN